jgi:hypothetical protein
MKNAAFWNMTPCGSCMDRSFGETNRLHHQGEKNQQTSLLHLLVTVNDVPGSLILLTLMIEAICSSETSLCCKSLTPSHPRRRHSSLQHVTFIVLFVIDLDLSNKSSKSHNDRKFV